MILSTKEKELELIFKTRLVQQFEERAKVDNSRNFWTNASQDEDLKVLATALLVFGDKALKNIDEAYDFIDAYLDEGEATIADLYFELLREMNTKGFFGQKLSAQELRAKLNTPVIEMRGIMDKVADTVAAEMMNQAPKLGQG